MADRSGYIGRAPGDSSVIIARQTFEPTGIQTDFTFASGYTPGYIDVYLNGSRLIVASDYTATDGSVVGLTTNAINGDVLECVAYKAFNLGNVNSAIGNFTVGGDLTVTGTTTLGAGASVSYATTSFGLEGSPNIAVNNITGVAATFSGAIDVDGHTELDDVNVSGAITATTFTGNLTGNASGTASGLTGTPDITVRNITGVAATFTGVVTYEDVTNVDSLGIITARGGFEIGAAGVGGTITSVGNAEFVGIVTAQSYVSIADSIVHTGDINTSLRFPSADTITAETGGSERMRVTSNGGLLLSNGILVEHCKIVSTAWSTTNDISLDDGNVFLNTANLAGTNNTIDITSSAGLNVDLAVGDMTSVTLITAVNATTAFINHITIGAAAVTESWVGGSAPTDGGNSGYDVYVFTIIKTAANTYVCIANQAKGS